MKDARWKPDVGKRQWVCVRRRRRKKKEKESFQIPYAVHMSAFESEVHTELIGGLLAG